MGTTAVRRLRHAAIIVAALLGCMGLSPAVHALRLNGLVSFQTSDGTSGQIGFNCDGENPCRGTWVMEERDAGCSNSIGRVGPVVITGLGLSAPGPIAGTITFSGIQGSTTRHADGSCSSRAGTVGDFATAFTGNWNGASASLSFPPSADGSGTINFSGTLSAVSRLVRISGTADGQGREASSCRSPARARTRAREPPPVRSGTPAARTPSR